MINFDKFLQWAESRFNGDVVVSGNEIKVNSIFCDDFKHHLWCNPYGGKYERPNGVFHCWKTDKKGSLITLVMMVDNCSYEEALEILETEDISLANLQKKLEEFWDKTNTIVPKEEDNKLALPPYTLLISDLNEGNPYRIQAEAYLMKRNIPSDGLYICYSGDYANRIIIPYYDKNNNLIYFNARNIGKAEPKYLGPKKEIGIGKGDVIYMPFWPPEGSEIYLTEGEFDAIILFDIGLYSAAFGGKEMSEKQLNYLREFKPILSIDNDKAGNYALPKLAKSLIENGFEVKFIRPPKNYKDWNEMYIKLGSKLVKKYIMDNQQVFDELNWKLNVL